MDESKELTEFVLEQDKEFEKIDIFGGMKIELIIGLSQNLGVLKAINR